MTPATKRLARHRISRGLLFVTPAVLALLLFTGLESWLLFAAMALILIWLTVNSTGLSLSSWPRRVSDVHVLLFLFWLWLAFSILWSRAPAESLFRLWPATLFIPVIWAFLLEPEPQRFWRQIGIIGAITAVILAIISCYQVFFLAEAARSVFVTRNSHAGFMNLVLIPVFAYAVRSHATGLKIPRWFHPVMAVLIVLLSFSIALTASRAGALSLLGGLGLVITISVKLQLTKYALAWAGLVAVGYLLAQIPANAEIVPLAERSLFVVHDRLIIWANAWRMLVDAPWIGTGIGTYALAWPPYKNPADPSSGYYVHNDYLQLWIETGVPGLGLLLAIGILLFLRYWRALRARKCSNVTSMELTGLIAAVCANAAHSFVDFNYHVPIVMLGLGLVLGQFIRITTRITAPVFQWAPSKNIRKGSRIAAITILMIALAYVLTYGLGDVFAKIGAYRARQGELVAAESSFRAAAVFGRINDRVLSGYADFLRQLLLQLPDPASNEKRHLFDSSRLMLDRVEQLNPLRWDSALIRARLYQNNPGLIGDDGMATSINAYRYALVLNPWFHEARVELAMLLLSVGDPHSAANELWSGMHFAYAKTPKLTRYYSLALAVHEQWGAPAQQDVIRKKLNDLEETLRNLGPIRDCPLPARLWRTC